MGYQYDSQGRRTKLVYPDNSYITYHYDDIGRLWQIRDDADPYNVIASFTYDDLSRRTSMTLGNGSVTTYDYEDKTGNDNLGDRVEGITIQMYDPDYTVLTFTYTYDAVGNCLTKTIHTTDNSFPAWNVTSLYGYGYDDTYRMLTTDAPSGQNGLYDETYTYDNVGNWLAQVREANHSFTPNNMNQYSLIDGTRQPTYDNSGNMVNDGAGRLCEFDSENRLMTGSKGSTDWEYDYDPFGRRVLKDIDEGEEVTRYVYDGPHCIAEYNGAGTLLRKYVYGPGIDEALMMINVSGQTQTKYYYHRDALGNVMALSEGTGFIVEGYTYSAFGMAIVNTTPGPDGDWLTPDAGCTATVSAFGNPYMFTGRRYDWETGLYYYRARYYDATLGRFISADPLRYLESPNLYQYCLNNPTNRLDPFGLGLWSGLWSFVDCFNECMEDNDPLDMALEAAIAALVAMPIPKAMVASIAEGVGDVEFARQIRVALKRFPGQSRFTTLPSTIAAKLRLGGRSTLRMLGRTASRYVGPALVAYGLALAAVETHCAGACSVCAANGIDYDHDALNILDSIKETYFD